MQPSNLVGFRQDLNNAIAAKNRFWVKGTILPALRQSRRINAALGNDDYLPDLHLEIERAEAFLESFDDEPTVELTPVASSTPDETDRDEVPAEPEPFTQREERFEKDEKKTETKKEAKMKSQNKKEEPVKDETKTETKKEAKMKFQNKKEEPVKDEGEELDPRVKNAVMALMAITGVSLIGIMVYAYFWELMRIAFVVAMLLAGATWVIFQWKPEHFNAILWLIRADAQDVKDLYNGAVIK